ncbi:hypothetical protein EMIT0P218_30166 [Pseudomonas sp. IT-P218]
MEYAQTALGHALGPAMAALIEWAELRHQHDEKGKEAPGMASE